MTTGDVVDRRRRSAAPAATRFEELIPSWVFAVQHRRSRLVLAVAVPILLAVPLLAADTPPRSLYSPLLLLALVVVAGTCGSWAAAITAAIVVGLHWRYSLGASWGDLAERERVSLVGMAAFAAAIVAATQQMERAVAAVRHLDEERRSLLRAAEHDRARIDEHLRELEAAFAERDRIARTLSTALLPPTLPDLPGFEAEGWLLPAGGGEIAGDFYDLFPVGRDWVAVLGDVCGKGAEAAAVTSLARYAARATALHDPNPARISDVANTALTSDESDLFCTMAIVHHCATAGVIQVTLAGHHPVRLVRDGEVQHLGHVAPPLGYAEAPARTATTELLPGDVVVLFSDGLVERDPSYGCEELDETLRAGGTAPEVAARLREQISQLPPTRLDDTAVLVISRSRPDA